MAKGKSSDSRTQVVSSSSVLEPTIANCNLHKSFVRGDGVSKTNTRMATEQSLSKYHYLLSTHFSSCLTPDPRS